ncbi:107-domain-containing protein [Podospora appendiculata]|uniref:Nuclear pore complex protein n=1 Tax=Podospora appendiculata TaxID=314037 RepID=A0AAE1CIF1_9PEZI|nr:107-domain-containing protein [Podospora appendiculata]
MAPAFDLPLGSDDDSLPSRAQSPIRAPVPPVDMAALEATYQESNIKVSDEVEFFAAELDRYNTDLRGSPAEKRAQVFKLVDSYHTYTRKKADKLRDRQSNQRSARKGRWQRGPSADMDIDEVDGVNVAAGSEELQRVEEEAQTWDLLRRLLPLRYREPAVLPTKAQSDPSTQSRGQWWDDFIVSDSIARERKIVLEWLQSGATTSRPPIDEVVSELQQNAERGDILAHGWLHTRHKLKLQKSVNGFQGVLDPNDPGVAVSHLGSNTLVTQLDPDAITRQARKVESQDEFFERAIWLGCFEMLRRGCSMSEIREWCSVRTGLWRAASLAPLPLSNPEDEDQVEFDPASLVLWKRMCLASARDGGSSDYDRAVYGLLAGDMPSVEKVCKTWDDFLFANYSALLRTQFDSFLIKGGGEGAERISKQFIQYDPVAPVHDPVNMSKRIIGSLEKDPRTSAEASRTLKVLQGAIISNDLDRHLYHQGLVLAKHANQRQKSKLIFESTAVLPRDFNPDRYFDLSDHHNMRISAHVLIIVTTLDRLGGFLKDDGPLQYLHRSQENIIASYVSYLRLAHLEEMVPLYSSKLYGTRLYETLSRNIIHITDREARLQQLTIMRKLGLDLAEFAKTQPQIFLGDVDDQSRRCEAKGKFLILEKGPATLKYGRIVKPDFFGEDAELVDYEDELIIRSMEWLMLVPGLFKETCVYAIRAYKYFLKSMRLRAARALSDRVSGRRIVQHKTSIPINGADDDFGPSWFEHFTNGKSNPDFINESNTDMDELTSTVRNMWELECLVKALDSMETLSSLAGITREETTASREMWQHASDEIRKAKACMQPILRGWLLTANEDDQDYHDLREAYIPETVLAFVSSLHFVGTSLSRDNLLECMELAATIAEKGSDVAHEFIKCGRMKELVEAFASCSKALAIWTSDKKGSQPNSKKMREMGWSRELWSVKP